ncbi:hypothetical protein DEU29_1173 [Idiomarina aquatica]|uniref:Uncharacterized protein n=1 Tax=Idiomarina aquatica TaxID=1327752 RepID=A0A4R6NY66_9GAMM|nr:hypothetical protein [Idiomarina aquatica]TDP29425.1 hypothetical protein DEU29_1173 [Idiomarina aquatica]
MARITLLLENGSTKTTSLSRVPGLDEYLFVDNQTLYVGRVIHISTLFRSQALVSVRIVENQEKLHV